MRSVVTSGDKGIDIFQESVLEAKYKKLLQDLLFASHDMECKCTNVNG